MGDTSWLDARPERVPSWIDERFEEGLVLHDPAGRIVELDVAGGAVVALCDGTRTGADIIDLLRAAFPDVPEAQLSTDVTETLDHLLAAGVIRIA